MTYKSIKSSSPWGRLGGVLLLLLLCLLSCKSPDNIWYKANVSPSLVEGVQGGGSVHDTLYQSNIRYDSIYLDNSIVVDRSGDTVFIRENHLQYKYKYQHDTILSIKIDSIPVVRTVTVPGDPYIPPWCKWLAIAAVIGLIATIIIIYRKVATFIA